MNQRAHITPSWMCVGALGALIVTGRTPQAGAQTVDLNGGVRVADTWCFPAREDPTRYYYLPATARLAIDDEGRPKFSFVRYVASQAASEGSDASAPRSGGGVLTVLITYDTPAEVVRAIEDELRILKKGTKVSLQGPIQFVEGRYNLVSSILGAATGGERRSSRLLAAGKAPALEGQTMAWSFSLSPDNASLFLRSLQMAAPDLSIIFDLTFRGLAAAYDAEVRIKWDEVRKNEALKAKASAYFVSADIERTFDELRRNHAIEIDVRGAQSNMQALVDRVYERLVKLMFQPVEPTSAVGQETDGVVGALKALATKKLGVGASVGYRLKEVRRTGVSVLRFNQREPVDRHAFITFNMGPNLKPLRGDERYFRDVSLDVDRTFQQRRVEVRLDAATDRELGQHIEFTAVTFEKEHASGAKTTGEVAFSKDPGESTKARGFVYGWHKGDRIDDWLRYRYRARWGFRGGGAFTTPWMASSSPVLPLHAPFHRKEIVVDGDDAVLEAKGVRWVAVQVTYDFFGRRRAEQLRIRPGQEGTRRMEVLLPQGQEDYAYKVVWRMKDGRRRIVEGKDDIGVVVIDEL